MFHYPLSPHVSLACRTKSTQLVLHTESPYAALPRPNSSTRSYFAGILSLAILFSYNRACEAIPTSQAAKVPTSPGSHKTKKLKKKLFFERGGGRTYYNPEISAPLFSSSPVLRPPLPSLPPLLCVLRPWSPREKKRRSNARRFQLPVEPARCRGNGNTFSMDGIEKASTVVIRYWTA